MITENLSTLKIHKLTKEQYDREYQAGNIDDKAIYLTTDDNCDSDSDIQSYIDEVKATAEQAMDTANAAVKTVNGIEPDENGNVEVEAGNAELKPLGYTIRGLMGYKEDSYYNGNYAKQLDIPLGFEHLSTTYSIERGLMCMPAVLNGTYKVNDLTEDTYTFEYAYAFSDIGDTKAVVIIEPATGKLWHFEFGNNDYIVKNSVIGEGGIAELQPLTFTGAVEATYDGSEVKEINIPQGFTTLTSGNLADICNYGACILNGLFAYTDINGLAVPVMYENAWAYHTSSSIGDYILIFDIANDTIGKFSRNGDGWDITAYPLFKNKTLTFTGAVEAAYDGTEFVSIEIPVGKDGSDGADGGYYIPAVSQRSENTMDVSFIGSKDDMQSVNISSITLPAGKDGKDGTNGNDGYTPQKGVDYWTDADKSEMITAAEQHFEDNAKGDIVQSVLDALQGLPVFGVVDENNIITVTSQLTDGTYVLKYENADGSLTEIGTIIVGTGNGGGEGDEPIVIVNLLETAVGTDGAVFNGVGYMDGYYLTGSNTTTPIYVSKESGATHFVTGYIPYTLAQAQAQTPIYVKGANIDTAQSHERIGFYPSLTHAEWLDPLKLSASAITVTKLSDGYFRIVPPANVLTEGGYNFTDIQFIRLSLSGSGTGVIITVGQEIPN